MKQFRVTVFCFWHRWCNNQPQHACYCAGSHFATKTILIRQGLVIRTLGVPWGVRHQDVCSGSFGSCMLGGGASMGRNCSSTSHTCGIRLGSGNLEARSNAFISYIICRAVSILSQGFPAGPCIVTRRLMLLTKPVSDFNVVGDWCIH